MLVDSVNGKESCYVIHRESESMWGLRGAGSSVGVRLLRKKEHCSMSDLLDSDTSSLHMEMLHTGLSVSVSISPVSPKTRQQLTSHSLIYALVTTMSLLTCFCDLSRSVWTCRCTAVTCGGVHSRVKFCEKKTVLLYRGSAEWPANKLD